jgi:hypothetical protein
MRETISKLEYFRGNSVHDYDVYMELRLREKLGQLPQLKLVLVPAKMDITRARGKIIQILEQLI